MQYRPDITIFDRSGAAVAITEVKALSDASVETATRYLRNLFAHGIAPQARYTLLITPDHGYLWFTSEEILRQSPPSLIFSMEPIIQRYLPPGDTCTSVGELVLESIVKQWLSDLADGVGVEAGVTSELRESGFLDAIRDGRVESLTPV